MKDEELSSQLKAFEQAFGILNDRLFESALPKTVITITPTARAYGHFTPSEVWKNGRGETFHEINLDAGTLDRTSIQMMATLTHEMVHLFCWENGIKDTSRRGRYHNKQFKAAAEEHGLIISYDSSIGWSSTEPGKKLLLLEKEGAFATIREALCRPRSGVKHSAKSSTRKYVCPVCGLSVRATREVDINCNECNEKMIRQATSL